MTAPLRNVRAGGGHLPAIGHATHNLPLALIIHTGSWLPLTESYGLDVLKQEAERLFEQMQPDHLTATTYEMVSNEYHDAQLRYEQAVDAALNDPRLIDEQRQEIVNQHIDAVSGVWLDAHPQFRDEAQAVDEIRERQRKAQDQGEGYGY